MITRIAPVFLLALFLLAPAAPASAQDAGERSHTVRSGETLSGIASAHLGSAELWQRIWEANRPAVSDPHLIHPGLRLRIPGSPGAGDAATARVMGFGVPGEDAATAQAPPDGPDTERRALLRSRPFTALDAEPSGDARTVFHGSMRASASRSDDRPGVLISLPEDRTALSISAMQAAAWIQGADDAEPGIGQIRSFVGDGALRVERTTVQVYDEVELVLDDAASVAVGDMLVAYHRVDRVRHRGEVMAPSGLIRVVRLTDAGAVGQVVNSFDRLSLGHSFFPCEVAGLSPGVHAEATDRELRGTVVGFRERKEIYLPGDQAFLDLGRDDGIEVGDEFVGVVGNREEWDERIVGRFQVIRVDEAHATVRLRSTESPSAIRSGLEVALSRKMP
ncbi:MAG: LysM peptidoglycan-binding domain-containing protein [Gemmatimonadales bacterium]|nr:MAG: LysM peptidoglycan-binding domain-containing protein [Gemmatimonadales bacterium]